MIACADNDKKDYLLILRDTLARVGEINRLTWNDVDLEKKNIRLHTRKKKGGHLTPRVIPMTSTLFEILRRRYLNRDKAIRWVFWRRYKSRKTGEMVTGPYADQKNLMRGLCTKAGVEYFRFHALRHAGSSIMDNIGVPIGTIKGYLGHENRLTTEIYLHSSKQMERTAIDLYEKAWREIPHKSHTGNEKGDSISLTP